MSRTRSLRTLALGAIVASLVLAGTVPFWGEARAAPQLAPDFTLTDIFGHNFTLSSYRGTDVVVIDFTSLTCSACQLVEKNIASIYASYNQTGSTDVHVISIFTNPGFADTIPALRAYHAHNNITWTMAQDTSTDTVSLGLYGASDLPVVVIVNKQGQAVYDGTGLQQSTLATSISNALKGTASAISIVTVSVFALAMVAGVTTFFSPCAFPMFPGYMSLFLGLNVATAAPGSPGAAPSNGAYSHAARRALSAGTVSALGMMIVFLLIGVALIFAASFIGSDIPYFLVIVGAILIGLGALLLTNLQYWRIVTPLQNLWHRLTGKPADAGIGVSGSPMNGRRLYLTLFGYGMGYAAAAAGCVAPVILSTVVAGMALGLLSGMITILIFSLTAAALMIGVTLALAVAGQRYVNQLKAYTPLIKKISAAALVLVGVYLIYFYYTAWIGPLAL